MDSGGKSDRCLSVPGDPQSGGLLRAVSFPNYFRGFWDHHPHHHSDIESESSSTVSSRAPSVHHIPVEPIHEGAIVVIPPPSNNNTSSNAADIRKLPEIEVTGSAADNSSSFFIGSTPIDSRQCQSRTVDSLSLSTDNIQSTKPSSLSAKAPLPLHRQHGGLLTALFHHDLTHRPVESRQVGQEQHHGAAEQQDRAGLFGLPSRVRVTGRELNMMSPISF